jgi:hypothetical protein
MFGLVPFCVLPFAVAEVSTPPAPVILVDTHDGDNKKKKRFDAEAEKRAKRRQEIIAAYEELVEGKPRVAQEIVAPFVETTVEVEQETAMPVAQINFDALLNDVVRMERLYRELQELDDEEALLLLL